MSDLLRVVERSAHDPMEVENYMAREHAGGEGEDPTAPHAAGAECARRGTSAAPGAAPSGAAAPARRRRGG